MYFNAHVSRRFISILLAGLIGFAASFAVVAPVQAQAGVKTCSASTPSGNRPTLAYGDSGSCVTVLQDLLVKKGVFNAASKKPQFGPVTKAAVVKFQGQAGLVADGIVGKNTWCALTGACTAAKPTTGNTGGVPAACLKRTGKVICIDKYGSTYGSLWALQDRKIVMGPFKVATGDGRPGSYDTFEGTSKVDSLKEHHVSSIYNQPMPNSIFFYGDQAIHQGGLTPSHGCVHLPGANSARLFRFADLNTYVTVTP